MCPHSQDGLDFFTYQSANGSTMRNTMGQQCKKIKSRFPFAVLGSFFSEKSNQNIYSWNKFNKNIQIVAKYYCITTAIVT